MRRMKYCRGLTHPRHIALLMIITFYLLGAGNAQAQGSSVSVSDPSTSIANYLLGKSSDPTGLDANSDSKIDVADLVYAVSHRAPVVSSFSIAGGANSATNRTVTLNNTCTGTPKYYMASESSNFSGAAWITYSSAPSFTLSSGNLSKTVYFKVQDANGMISSIVSDTITLAEISTLTVGAAALTSSISPAGDSDWFKFTASATSTYVIESWPGTLADNIVFLYGPNSQSTQIVANDNSGTGNAAKIGRTLVPGTYYVKVQASGTSTTGDYTIKVTDIGALKVSSFSVNSGASVTTNSTVTLKNSCTGLPTHYMASESSSFSGAVWTSYASAPSFILSAGNLSKRVYFKVKDSSGTESPVVSDTITLAVTTSLTVGASAVTGSISPAGESDWYKFTTSATSTYVIETWPGTLANNTLSLYGPNSMATLISSDDNSGTGNAAKLALSLKSGTYYIKIQAAETTSTGNYTIKVSNIGALKVDSLAINSGDSLATNRAVTLNNTYTGAPTHYMASESSSFSGASWKSYSTAPSFTLSSGNASKKVYFKVKDLSGTVSAVVSDTITLKEMALLPTDGSTVDGNINKSTEEDWYIMTVDTATLYSIKTYQGSLVDTTLRLADEPSPDSDEWITSNDNIDDSNLMSLITIWLDPGTYYIRIKSGDGSTGSYSLRAWQEENTKLTVNGSTLSGYIDSSGEVDWYRFTVSSSGVYSIQTVADDLEYGYMELYSGSFKKIGLDGNGTGVNANDMPAITASLSAGTYLLRFAGASSSDTGSYGIKVFSGSISGGTVALMINGPTTGGSIGSPPSGNSYDVDWYQLIVNEEDEYAIKTSAGSLELGFLALMDEDLSTLSESTTQAAGETMPKIENVTLEPGTYYIGFCGYSTSDRGTYKIQVSN